MAKKSLVEPVVEPVVVPPEPVKPLEPIVVPPEPEPEPETPDPEPVKPLVATTSLLDLETAVVPPVASSVSSIPVPIDSPVTPIVATVSPVEKAPCNCIVSQIGKGRHAATCPRWGGPNKKDKTVSTVATLLTSDSGQAAVDYDVMGGLMFDMVTNASSMMLGPEWQPNNPEERKLVVASVAAYLRSKEIKDIPPGMMLALVLTVYAAPRITKPSTAGKLRIGWAWLKEKFRRKKSGVTLMSKSA